MHFTFNALNALAALTQTGDIDGVERFIGHFSRLLRTHLNTSDQVVVSLREEVEFIVNYVELQRIRFERTFELELDIPSGVDLDRKIPKMLIQTHVENAIKHGLRPKAQGTTYKAQGARHKAQGARHKAQGARHKAQGKEEEISGESDKGVVRVIISQEDRVLDIIVEDNGVGRGHSTVSAFESTGRGLPALDRIIQSVKQLYGMEISQTITDLKDGEGRAEGTRVRIIIDG